MRKEIAPMCETFIRMRALSEQLSRTETSQLGPVPTLENSKAEEVGDKRKAETQGISSQKKEDGSCQEKEGISSQKKEDGSSQEKEACIGHNCFCSPAECDAGMFSETNGWRRVMLFASDCLAKLRATSAAQA